MFSTLFSKMAKLTNSGSHYEIASGAQCYKNT
jgi:hypothetical protein